MKRILWFFVLLIFMPFHINADEPVQLQFRDPFIADDNVIATMPTITRIFHLRYMDATKLTTLLGNKDSGLLSNKGHINSDPRTNSIWVQDFSKNITAVQEYITQFDVPVKQILIQAYIVNVDENFSKELGLRFGTHQPQQNIATNELHMDLPLPTISNGRFNVAVAKLGNDTLLELELHALENEGRGKIISNPRLMTTNLGTAYIASGEDIPYQEKTAHGNTSVAFKKAVLSLKVTPQITPNNKIVLNIAVNQDKVSNLIVNGTPAIRTQEINTQVQLSDGQTIVLGGIFEEIQEKQKERIPFLSKLPGIGLLFQNQLSKSQRRELLIFVTPKIVL